MEAAPRIPGPDASGGSPEGEDPPRLRLGGSEMNTHIEKDRQAAYVYLSIIIGFGFRSIVGKFQAKGETAEYIFDSREAVNSK